MWWDKTRNVIQPADHSGWGRYEDNDITYLGYRLHIQHIALRLVHKLWRVLLPLIRIVIGRCQHFNLAALFCDDLFVLLLLFYTGCCCWIVGLYRDRRCFLLEAATAWGYDFHSTRSLLLFSRFVASCSCYSYKLGRLSLGLLRFAATNFQSVGPGLAFGRDDGCGGRFSLSFGCAFASSATFWLGLTDRFGIGDGGWWLFTFGWQTSMVVKHAHCWLQIEKLDRVNFANACVGGLPCHYELMEFFSCRMFSMAQQFSCNWKENRISVR